MKIFLIVLAIVVVVGLLLFWFYKKKVAPKLNEYNSMLDANKIVISIFIIEKFKGKLTDQNVPKSLIDQFPKMLRGKKFPLVKAKVGSQFQTLIADDKIFASLPTKKMVKVELAGMYIVGMK